MGGIIEDGATIDVPGHVRVRLAGHADVESGHLACGCEIVEKGKRKNRASL